jgi:hypothetical protein
MKFFSDLIQVVLSVAIAVAIFFAAGALAGVLLATFVEGFEWTWRLTVELFS